MSEEGRDLAGECAVADPRFWEKVDRGPSPGQCWLWTGYRNPCGYGMLQRRSMSAKPLLAHRYSMYLAFGKMPSLYVLHSCDTPACVNPAHLREGTAADNHKDAVERGRHRRPPRFLGDSHPRRRLSEVAVLEIRARLASGERHRDIAASYGVCRSAITAVSRGANWNLPYPKGEAVVTTPVEEERRAET